MRNSLYVTLILILFGMITSCSKTPVDLIVQNARMYTMDDAFTTVTSIAVKDGKIGRASCRETL